ncbi:fused MFS/spermidine synthase [Burkholderia sp. L27(2015)]|uniref:fused MFS/spermidine synthase n=1 Tax=Burkholderia sp. L27(2015) TaxID=1641858 RepID=UPI00131CA9A9|nr:fused MFS/spermidine synthase [Burkholderia sp. L27(2015)]
MKLGESEGQVGVGFIAVQPSGRQKQGEQINQWTRTLCVLFFFSGFPALIYQLVWQHALFRIFGVNIESVTIVVTAFMLGLGVGSLAGGWLSRRHGMPLMPVLAAIELLTGLFGTVSLSVFDKVGSLVLGMPLSVTALVALALVAVPTLLMGATLPMLVGHLVKRSGNVGNSVGLLYYVNTMGAGAACLISTVLLFPFLGMQISVYVAVAINTLVALGALGAYWRDYRTPAAAMVKLESSGPRIASLHFAPVAALAFLGGFISLSYEIFFVRTISYAMGGLSVAFTLTLAAFLIGLASGSRQAADWCSATGEEGPKHIVGSILKANLIGLLFLPVLAHLAWANLGIVAVALVMVYLLARYWGALLPSLAHFGIAPDSRAGTRTALLYFANIVGAAIGSILTGFVLMDHLGLVSIAAVLVAAGCLCAVLLSASLPLPGRAKWRHASWAAGGFILAITLLPASASGTLEALQGGDFPEAHPRLTRAVENRSGVITVDHAGVVYGNGMYDGRFNVDLVNDTNGIVRPFALSLFHDHPQDVLMIGLSSGSWAQVIANNPQVASLTVIEINPGYLKLIAQTPEVASVLKNPKVRIITDDGRRWLRLNADRKFDAVVANTTWYFRANAANLLSSEYLALVKAHLKPDGIYFYNATESDRVERTACLSFPYGARFANHMLVSLSPLVWDFTNWRNTLEAYKIDGRPVLNLANEADRKRMDELMSLQASLALRGGTGQTQPIESCTQILARTADRMPVTDDNMGSEYRRTLGME